MNTFDKLIVGTFLMTALSSSAFSQNLNGCVPSNQQPKKCDVVTVPEPSTLLLLGAGLAGLAVARRFRKK